MARTKPELRHCGVGRQISPESTGSQRDPVSFLPRHGESVCRGRATATFEFVNEKDQWNHYDRQPPNHAEAIHES